MNDPPKTPFTALAKALDTELEPEDAKQWIEQALAVKTNNQDTHPCLKDRLTALGYSLKKQPSLSSNVKLSAAQQFLETAMAQLIQTLEAEWRTAVNFQWRERYTCAQRIRYSLIALEEKAASQSLTVEEAWNRAQWTRDLIGNKEAIPLIRSVLEMQAEHVSANFLLGQILLEQEDEAGIDYLEKAMAKAVDPVLPGCQLIYTFLQKHRRENEAAQYRQRAEHHYDQLHLAQQERRSISASDRFEPHGLSAEVEAQFRQQLARYPQIKEAYLVRKVVQYFPEKPFYILAVSRKLALIEMDKNREYQKLIDQLAKELEFPAQTWIVLLNSGNQPLAKALRQTVGGSIYCC